MGEGKGIESHSGKLPDDSDSSSRSMLGEDQYGKARSIQLMEASVGGVVLGPGR